MHNGVSRYFRSAAERRLRSRGLFKSLPPILIPADITVWLVCWSAVVLLFTIFELFVWPFALAFDVPDEPYTWLFIRPQGGSEAGWLPNFRGLILGCMDSYASEKRRILQGFSRSTRFAFLCTALNSNLQSFAPLIFAIFS